MKAELYNRAGKKRTEKLNNQNYCWLCVCVCFCVCVCVGNMYPLMFVDGFALIHKCFASISLEDQA